MRPVEIMSDEVVVDTHDEDYEYDDCDVEPFVNNADDASLSSFTREGRSSSTRKSHWAKLLLFLTVLVALGIVGTLRFMGGADLEATASTVSHEPPLPSINSSDLIPKEEEETDTSPSTSIPPDAASNSIPSETTPQTSSSSSSTSSTSSSSLPSRSYEQDNDRAIPSLSAQVDYSISSARKRFHDARIAMLNHLANVDYGPENFARMFVRNKTGIGFLALRSAGLAEVAHVHSNKSIPLGGVSWDRLKRKFMLKVLQVQQARNTNQNTGNAKMVPFVWATGGHSSAAAHGDLYNESYTAVIERFVRPSLEELGIWFQGKNYAMGGTSSGPEVALCVPAIFGQDVDALSWDFGMTDGGDSFKFELYFRQASLLPSRPACVALQIGGRHHDGQMKMLRNLEDSGAPALYLPPEVWNDVINDIPDTFGLSDSEIQTMPPFVKNFKCEGGLETGNPGCAGKKWTHLDKEICESIKYRTGWHPGWKWHALMGNLIGFSLLEIMEEALTILEGLDLSDPVTLYRNLKELEDQDYEKFSSSDLTSKHDEMLKGNGESNKDFDIPYLFKNQAICHTALLPAETRYLGILTESNKVGFFNYDKGVSMQVASKQANDGEFIRLAYDAGQRQSCSVLLQMDYKDYFYLGEKEGMKKLILPNTAEIKTYGTGQPLKGLVGFSHPACDWGRCPKGETREKGLESGEWEVFVNGVKVIGLVNIWKNVNFFRHSDGVYFTPNSDGQYEIQARVTQVGAFLRFSSFIFL